MKCPVCGKNTAFLYFHDGIHHNGKNIEGEVLCDGECMDMTDMRHNSPMPMASVEVDVIIKRGSIKVFED